MTHLMSPATVAALILLAAVVDWMSVGPNSIRDRLAFCMALPAFWEGWSGGPLARWTTTALTNGIDRLMHMSGSAYLTGASAHLILSAVIGCLAIYAVGCLLPVKASKRLGAIATLQFPSTPLKRINTRLWLLAATLGILAEVPRGFVGDALRVSILALDGVVAPLPNILFGVI